jgi:hypothetical protein
MDEQTKITTFIKGLNNAIKIKIMIREYNEDDTFMDIVLQTVLVEKVLKMKKKIKLSINRLNIQLKTIQCLFTTVLTQMNSTIQKLEKQLKILNKQFQKPFKIENVFTVKSNVQSYNRINNNN